MAGALAFTLVRVALLAQNSELLSSGIDNDTEWVLRAFGVGFRFDLNWAYMTMLPSLALLAIGQFMGRHCRIVARIATWWLVLAYSLSLFAAIGNIPYFAHFQTHINAMGMKYAGTDFGAVARMIITENNYLFYTLAAIAAATLFAIFILWLARNMRITAPSPYRWRTTIYLVVLGALFLWADRGFYLRFRTLEPRDTMISNNAFINKLGVNPLEPFIVSISTANSTLTLMPHNKAREIVLSELQRDESFTHHVEAKPSPYRNIVILMEESFTASRLAREGHTEHLMPNMDRLTTEGLYFENTYSTGTHTCYAIYSLVTSLPGFVDKHPLQDGLAQPLNTIYEQLYSNNKLTTYFFVTHGPNFDNVRGFLTAQGFERLYSRTTYHVETNKTWGVDDHIMLDYALEEIDREWKAGNGVCAVCLTCSNHAAFNPPLDVGYVPTENATDDESRAVQYADWAMQRFLDKAKEREWFDETLFVIMGDHGRSISSDFAIPQSLNHVPLLFYAPKHIKPEVRSDLVSQMDITPTAMSMMGLEYDNHTMGIDLMTTQRRMIPFGHDGHIAARDHEWLYIYDVHNKVDYLYDLTAEGNNRLINVAKEHPERVRDMHDYVAAMVQAGWDMHNAHSLWTAHSK